MDMVGSVGFEPTKASPTDLQSVPIGHSGNSPAGEKIYLNLAGQRTIQANRSIQSLKSDFHKLARISQECEKRVNNCKFF